MAEGAGLTKRQGYWREHLEACEESGQTTKAYAQAHGLSVSMMYAWRKKLANRSRGNRLRGFDRVDVSPPEVSSSRWQIVLPNGVEVGFSEPVDDASLSRVLKAASRL